MIEINAIYALFAGIGTLVGIIVTIVSPIMKLNKTISELNITMKYVVSDSKDTKSTIKEHGCQLDNHEGRLIKLEVKRKD